MGVKDWRSWRRRKSEVKKRELHWSDNIMCVCVCVGVCGFFFFFFFFFFDFVLANVTLFNCYQYTQESLSFSSWVMTKRRTARLSKFFSWGAWDFFFLRLIEERRHLRKIICKINVFQIVLMLASSFFPPPPYYYYYYYYYYYCCCCCSIRFSHFDFKWLNKLFRKYFLKLLKKVIIKLNFFI